MQKKPDTEVDSIVRWNKSFKKEHSSPLATRLIAGIFMAGILVFGLSLIFLAIRWLWIVSW